MLLLLLIPPGWTDSHQTKQNLCSLYEQAFRGSREVHVPKRLYEAVASVKRITSIALSDVNPFEYGTNQGTFFFPNLSNDDESSLYFDPYYGFGSLYLDKKDISHPILKAFRFDKKERAVRIVDVQRVGEYLRDKVFGFYKNLTNQSDGIVQINVKKNWALVLSRSQDDVYYIMNPKDLDIGADVVFLSRFQPTESDFPYRQFDRDIELLIYEKAKKSIVKSFTLPFTGSYLPIKTQTIGLQSVADQNLAYLVLSAPLLNGPSLTVPKAPRRWQVLVYDAKEDALYSIWHGMDETDGKKALSFSYYLGQEGLYFEVLKEGKIEVDIVDIDLKNATPLKEYETVDLLWNNKGLKAQWEKKIQEAKAKDPSFEERWE
jgi:hypothetical protein